MCGPSAMASSTAITATACATFQFAGVKVSWLLSTRAWAPLVTVTITSAVGWVTSTTL